MKTQKQAVKKAAELARKTGKPHYVVFSQADAEQFGGPYQVATEHDLDTFYAGISERNILYCTSN